MSVRCVCGFHKWAWFGPWYGGMAGNRICKRCGRHEWYGTAHGDYKSSWHYAADGVDWVAFDPMPPLPREVPRAD